MKISQKKTKPRNGLYRICYIVISKDLYSTFIVHLFFYNNIQIKFKNFKFMIELVNGLK